MKDKEAIRRPFFFAFSIRGTSEEGSSCRGAWGPKNQGKNYWVVAIRRALAILGRVKLGKGLAKKGYLGLIKRLRVLVGARGVGSRGAQGAARGPPGVPLSPWL